MHEFTAHTFLGHHELSLECTNRLQNHKDLRTNKMKNNLE